MIPLLRNGTLTELQKAAGQERPVFLVGVIPEGKEAAQVEQFELR